MSDQRLWDEIEKLKKKSDRLKTQESSGFTPLTTPLTSTSFDGDSFSDVAALTQIDLSNEFSVPAGITAVLLTLRGKDSASSGGLVYFNLWSKSDATIISGSLRLDGVTNDSKRMVTLIVACTGGDIWYTCEASGSGTLDIEIEIHGYWQ